MVWDLNPKPPGPICACAADGYCLGPRSTSRNQAPISYLVKGPAVSDSLITNARRLQDYMVSVSPGFMTLTFTSESPRASMNSCGVPFNGGNVP